MPAKAPFTQHEAVLLLDAYLKWQSGQLERNSAIRECSSKLRQMAINEGKKIDGSYRNVSGIWPQIRRMESAYEGRTVRLPATRLFAETVALYCDNPAKYQRLLQEAERMASGSKKADIASQPEPGYGGGGALEKAFCDWLKEDRHLAEAECSEQVSSIRRAELFAQEHALASKRLFTEDFSEAIASAAALFGNAEFVRLDALQGNGLKKAITQLLAFYASGGGAQGDDSSPNDEVLQPEPGYGGDSSLEEAWISYLKEEKHLAENSCSNYVYYIRKAERLAQEYGLSHQRLFTEDVAEAKATAEALFASTDFIQYSKEHRNNFQIAIKVLLAFYESVGSTKKSAQGEDHSADDAPQTASVEEKFYRYLKKEKHLAERSRSNYVYYIRRAERLAQEYGLSHQRLFTEDVDEAKATADALFAKAEFVEVMRSRGNNFGQAIRSLLKFYEAGGGEAKPPQGPAKDVNLASDDAPQTASIEEKFLCYLKEETSLSERSRSNYVYYIRKAERLAQEYGLKSARLFTEDVAEAAATADALFASEDFVNYMRAHKSNFPIAIKSLIAFYESIGGAQDVNHLEDDTACEPGRGYGAAIDGQDVDQLQLIEQLTEPSFDVEPYLAIIEEHFPNGYCLSFYLHESKMRKYYKEMTGAEMHVDADALAAALRRRCVAYEDKLYAPESLLSDELSERVFSFIDSCLDEGRQVVYYKAIFEKFELRSCRGSRILDAKMLKAYLQRCAGSKYFFGKKGLSRERGADADSVAEVRQYLRELCAPTKTADICKALPHIAEDNVRFILRHNSEFISNGNDEYFYADALQLDNEELEAIAHLMERLIDAAIEEPKFITASDLYDAIQKTQKSAFERNAAFSAIGWKNALKHKLKGRFAIGGIISMAGGPASKGDLFAVYGKWHKQFSLSEIDKLAKSVGLARIPFDALNKSAIRISRDCFAAKDDVWFSVEETDAALDRILGSRQYMPIKGIDLAMLPDASFAWTEFLLEQYADLYSETFCLLHGGYSKKGAFGAIVRRPQGFDSFDDLLADALAFSGVPLAADDALDYLADSGYLPRPVYKNIDALLSKAKRKEERAQG